MTVEDPVVPMTQWLFGGYGFLGLFDAAGNLAAAWALAIVLVLVTVVVLFVAYLSFAAQYGPVAGFERVGNMIRLAASDTFSLSPRRIFAMSWLAFQEAIRMRVLVAFAVFVFIMLFASWYLDVKTENPAQLYMGVVLGWTILLVLILALFLSTFSLPNDVKNHTIYTVVTKPVRVGEIILGRMIGFAVIGTLILLVMCVLSYVFVWRGLSHGHQLEADNAGAPMLQVDRSIKDEDGNFGWTGRTSETDYHRHRVYINPDGSGFTDMQKGHRHLIQNENGLAEPTAKLLRDARKVRKAVKTGEVNRALQSQLYSDLLSQSTHLAQTSRAAAQRAEPAQSDIHEDFARAMEAVRAAAEREKLSDVIAGLNDAQRAAGDFAIARFELGPPVGQLQARMPQYGTLSFLDRQGNPSDKGVNVGNEWTYRSYIEGGTDARAIWTFEGITPDRFPESDPDFEEGVPIDLTLRVFRTHKGDIERGIVGEWELVENLPEEERGKRQPLVSEARVFTAREFTSDRHIIPRKIKPRAGSRSTDGEALDLFEDFARDGVLIIRVSCEENAQYFGAAKSDVYVWTGNNYFFANFAKGYCTIWCQMVLVIAFGVMLSTFLSGPVAMLATVMSYVTGYFTQFITDVSTGKMEGGGPMESLIRIVEQRNLVTPMDEGGAANVVYGMDNVMLGVMWVFSYLMPDYSKLQTASYVAAGYNIPPALMSQHMLTTLVYVLVLAALGYLVFRSREVAA